MDFLEFAANKGMTQRPCGFNPIPKQHAVMLPPGAPHSDPPLRFDGELLENGDVIFRFAAPEGHTLKIGFGRGGASCDMTYVGGDVYEYLCPYDPKRMSCQTVHFSMDGVGVVNPAMPLSGSGKVSNYFEFPDPEQDFILLKDVPHGAVTSELYYAPTVGQWERCMIYTPPQYRSGEDSYPVLYLQGGAGGNELSWLGDKVNLIMDNLLAEGKCKPFIIVMNDTMVKMPYESRVDDFDGIEAIVTKDCRAFVEANYRVKADKWNRALAGFSLGSMLTSYIGFRHPELFAWLGIMSGSLRRLDNHNTYEDSPYLAIMDDFDRYAGAYKMVWRSRAEQETRYPNFEEDDAYMEQRGLDKLPSYERHIIPHYGHESGNMRRTFYQFAQLLFQER